MSWPGPIRLAAPRSGSSTRRCTPCPGSRSALFDVGPAGNQAQSRSDFANQVDNSDGLLYTHRIIDYEGPEQFCTAKGVCTTRQVALHTARGYDNMTGLGSPGASFVRALSGH